MKQNTYNKKVQAIVKAATKRAPDTLAKRAVRKTIKNIPTTVPAIKTPFKPGPNFNSKTGVTKVPGIKINSNGLRMGTRQSNPKSKMKQYGDKGYKPSNGIGVGM